MDDMLDAQLNKTDKLLKNMSNDAGSISLLRINDISKKLSCVQFMTNRIVSDIYRSKPIDPSVQQPFLQMMCKNSSGLLVLHYMTLLKIYKHRVVDNRIQKDAIEAVMYNTWIQLQIELFHTLFLLQKIKNLNQHLK